MHIATLIARILLGLIFFVFGLNGFFGFMPMPDMSGAAADFMGALHSSGYLYAVKTLEVVSGALLLAGFFVPLALVLIGPVIVNIALFHIFLDPAGLPMAILLVVLLVFLVYAHRDAFKGVFVKKA